MTTPSQGDPNDGRLQRNKRRFDAAAFRSRQQARNVAGYLRSAVYTKGKKRGQPLPRSNLVEIHRRLVRVAKELPPRVLLDDATTSQFNEIFQPRTALKGTIGAEPPDSRKNYRSAVHNYLAWRHGKLVALTRIRKPGSGGERKPISLGNQYTATELSIFYHACTMNLARVLFLSVAALGMTLKQAREATIGDFSVIDGWLIYRPPGLTGRFRGLPILAKFANGMLVEWYETRRHLGPDAPWLRKGTNKEPHLADRTSMDPITQASIKGIFKEINQHATQLANRLQEIHLTPAYASHRNAFPKAKASFLLETLWVNVARQYKNDATVGHITGRLPDIEVARIRAAANLAKKSGRPRIVFATDIKPQDFGHPFGATCRVCWRSGIIIEDEPTTCPACKSVVEFTILNQTDEARATLHRAIAAYIDLLHPSDAVFEDQQRLRKLAQSAIATKELRR